MLPDITQLSWCSAAYPFCGPDAPDMEVEDERCHDCGQTSKNLRYGPGLDPHKYCKSCWEFNFAGKDDDE